MSQVLNEMGVTSFYRRCENSMQEPMRVLCGDHTTLTLHVQVTNTWSFQCMGDDSVVSKHT